MSDVIRVFVEKKPGFDIEAGHILADLKENLGIKALTGLRFANRYDVQGLSREEFDAAKGTILSEPNQDIVTLETWPVGEEYQVFAVEYLPGQYDQRADSAEQCVKLLKEDEEPVIRSATTYVITAALTPEQEKAIKAFCINPVDSREAGEDKPSTLVAEFEVPEDIKTFEGFAAAPEAELKSLRLCHPPPRPRPRSLRPCRQSPRLCLTARSSRNETVTKHINWPSIPAYRKAAAAAASAPPANHRVVRDFWIISSPNSARKTVIHAITAIL